MNRLTFHELRAMPRHSNHPLLDLAWEFIEAAGGIPGDPEEARTRLSDTLRGESERRYSAGWLIGLEWDLWEGVEAGREPYLRLLSDAAGGWFRWDPEAGEYGEPVFVPAGEWATLYASGPEAFVARLRRAPEPTAG